MLKKKEVFEAQIKAAELIKKSGIKISDEEVKRIEVVDFGLGNLQKEGAQILTFYSTNRASAKVIVLFPYQTLPEHWHPQIGNDPGKEETIRVAYGTVYLYIPGEANIKEGFIPKGKEEYYTARHEIVMKCCDQITLIPGTKHWLQSGEEGAVMYSFSTCARDVLDLFSDPHIVRIPKIEE
mgnify:CR=1 FL=1